MLDNLTQRLAKVVKTIRGQARLTEDNIADMLREVRMALLEADVALPVVKEFVARIKARAAPFCACCSKRGARWRGQQCRNSFSRHPAFSLRLCEKLCFQ